MANKIQIRRGLKSALPILSAGEPAYTTDTRELFVGTGSGNVNMGGSHWYTGTAMSGTSTATTYSYSACPQVKLGDIYLNTTYGYVYQCTTAGSGTTAKWTYKGSIKGAAGSNATVTVDSALSSTSTNPVQNKVVNAALADKLDVYFSSNGYAGIDEVTMDIVDMKDSNLAPPTTITIGCVDSKHNWLIDYVCTGSNDTTLFQNAINALPDFGGKIVVLEGEYNITSQLTCDKNVVFEGMGKGTQINCPNHEFMKIASERVAIKDLFINATGSLDNDSGYLIEGTGQSSIIIDNCFISAITEQLVLDSSDYIYTTGNLKITNCDIVIDIRDVDTNTLQCTSFVSMNSNAIIDNCSVTLYNLYNASGSASSSGVNYDAYILRDGIISNSIVKCYGAWKSTLKGIANVINCGTIINCRISLNNYGSINNYSGSTSNTNGRLIGNYISMDGSTYMGFDIVSGNKFYFGSTSVTLYNNRAGSIITSNYFYNQATNTVKSNEICVFSLNKLRYSCTVSANTASIVESNLISTVI